MGSQWYKAELNYADHVINNNIYVKYVIVATRSRGAQYLYCSLVRVVKLHIATLYPIWHVDPMA